MNLISIDYLFIKVNEFKNCERQYMVSVRADVRRIFSSQNYGLKCRSWLCHPGAEFWVEVCSSCTVLMLKWVGGKKGSNIKCKIWLRRHGCDCVRSMELNGEKHASRLNVIYWRARSSTWAHTAKPHPPQGVRLQSGLSLALTSASLIKQSANTSSW